MTNVQVRFVKKMWHIMNAIAQRLIFTSRPFNEFCKVTGIFHKHIAPGHPYLPTDQWNACPDFETQAGSNERQASDNTSKNVHHQPCLRDIVTFPKPLPVQSSASSSAENSPPSEILPSIFNANEHLHHSSRLHHLPGYLKDYIVPKHLK
ncbi:unnamed protein product [Nezara viridula]|uniref:Uncharacterized protein n=1 Tax=Nezara viridula TaxID=85310 RepID=A0A9P0EHU6_NEZVI|nr:unnamed protein product [Nezara viridula]